MQLLEVIDVAAMDRPQINILADSELKRAWRAYVKGFGARRGSIIGMAALVAFMSMDDEERERWISKISTADTLGKLGEVIPAAFRRSDGDDEVERIEPEATESADGTPRRMRLADDDDATGGSTAPLKPKAPKGGGDVGKLPDRRNAARRADQHLRQTRPGKRDARGRNDQE